MTDQVNRQLPSNIFKLSDSIYQDEIRSAITTITKNDVLIHGAFYLNIATLLGVLFCGFGLSIEKSFQYVISSYIVLLLSGIIKLILIRKKCSSLASRFPPIELLDDAVLWISLPIIAYSGENISPIIAVAMVIASIFITSIFSIRYFINFIISKIVVFIICAYFLFSREYEQIITIYLIFSMFVVFILLVMMGGWLYVRHIRIVHLTIGYREIYQEIYEKNQILHQLKNERDRIIRHIGHDLRQPVNALSYALFNISHNRLNKMQEEQVRTAKSSINLVNHMIDEILRVAIYQDIKSLPVCNESFPLKNIFKEIEQEYTYIARKSGCELKVVGCSVFLISDSKLVARIIRNFISNAIRYGNGCKILLGARRRQDAIEIQVLDQGPGIEASLLDTIFEEFTQANRDDRGFGLGLNSAKNIAETIGGKISITSMENQGTVCTLSLSILSRS